ncbi:hypothetical protein LptCag_0577 [Leptospirillum ferriphilum]|uniref:Uncharacterized protein n=1 Tax=Leptospirillum ferriphilum TaxID=178606 RepID=A0A094YL49_9BACT|nr:hypothetical protein LptCag_0577 [Leptospirillum ferriphilum]
MFPPDVTSGTLPEESFRKSHLLGTSTSGGSLAFLLPSRGGPGTIGGTRAIFPVNDPLFRTGEG